METKTHLGRYITTLDQYGQPIKLRRQGNATTYKAFDSQSNREVALEIIPAGSVRISMQSKLANEAQAAKQLQQINIPMLYEFGIEENELIYASEMVEGVSAEDWVKAHGPMPIGAALRIASQVVKAIGAATFHGIFHHALNPANIMIVPGQTAEGEWPLIKIMKFAGVPPSYSTKGAAEAGVGDEINFVAPEQLERGAADFHSGIYSLGCTLWFLLSGVPPLAGAATVENASRVPSPVRRLIAQMLAIDPRERPSDPVALHTQIEDCIADVENKRVIQPPKVASPVAADPAARMIDPRPRRPFSWKPVAVAAVLLLVAALAAMVLPQRFRPRSARQEIGVPVGVPEPVATAARSAQPATAPARTEVAPAGGERPVLTSTAGADEKTDAPSVSSESETAPVSHQEPVQVAANIAPAAPAPEAPATDEVRAVQPSAEVIASNPSAKSMRTAAAPPAEGPVKTAPTLEPENTTTPDVTITYADANKKPGNAAAEVAIAAASPAPAAGRESAIVPVPPRQPSAETKPEPASAVAGASSGNAKKKAVAGAPPPASGNVRAQFLGTTPDGKLVFGLPSNERGYVAPGGAAPRRESTGRQRRREAVRPAEPPRDLPVLPALPVDD